MDDPRYKITEEDTLAMLKYLRHTAPEYATPENAIRLLEFRHVTMRQLRTCIRK
jgi:hypothetical protein